MLLRLDDSDIGIKEEHESINGYKNGGPQFKGGQNDGAGIVGNPMKAFVLCNSCEDKA